MKKERREFLRELFVNFTKKNENVNGVEFKSDKIVIYVKDINKLNAEEIPKTLKYNDEVLPTTVRQAKFKFTGDCINQAGRNISTSQLSILSGGCGLSCWNQEGGSFTLGGIFRDTLDGSLVGLTVAHSLEKYPIVKIDGYSTETKEQVLTFTTSWPITMIPFPFVSYFAVERFFNFGTVYGMSTNLKDLQENFNITSINIFHERNEANYPVLDTADANNCIGWVKRATPLAPYVAPSYILNQTDIGIIGLSGRLINSTSKNTIGMPASIRPNTIEFLTEQEWYQGGSTGVFYCGNETGPMGDGMGNQCVFVKGEKMNALIDGNTRQSLPSILIDPLDSSKLISYAFEEVWYIERDLSREPLSNREETPIVTEGDSGAILWISDSVGKYKVAGVIIGEMVININPLEYRVELANGGDWTQAYCALFIPIWKIKDVFNIEPWNDSNLTFNKERPVSVVLGDEVPFLTFEMDNQGLLKPKIIHKVQIENYNAFYSGTQMGTVRNVLRYNY